MIDKNYLGFKNGIHIYLLEFYNKIISSTNV